MFGREKKKDIDSMTIDEIEKYLESRKANEESDQSLKDRVDESVAEQEKEDGNEDSQSAKDRVDEALGEEEALKEEKEEEAHEEAQEEKHEEAEEKGEDLKKELKDLRAEVEELKSMLKAKEREPKKADGTEADKLAELEKKFN